VKEGMKTTIFFISIWAFLFILILFSLNIVTPDTDLDGYHDEIDQFPNNPNEWYDSDRDGVGDNSDDFPNDKELHKKCQVTCFKNEQLNHGELYYPPNCDCFNVSCQCKYVVVEWHLKETNNEAILSSEKGIYVEINNPTVSLRRDYQFFTTSDIENSFRCPICSNYDIGKWNIHFDNKLENTDVFMDCEIYRVL